MLSAQFLKTLEKNHKFQINVTKIYKIRRNIIIGNNCCSLIDKINYKNVKLSYGNSVFINRFKFR